MLMSYTVELAVVFSGPRPYDPPVEGSWPIRSLKSVVTRMEKTVNDIYPLGSTMNSGFLLVLLRIISIVGYSYDVLSSLSAALV